MNKSKKSAPIVLRYSVRLFTREWRKFILPIISLSFTAGIVLSVLLLTNSASTYLVNKNKELVGADMSLETNYFLEKEVLDTVVPKEYIQNISEEFSFSTIIENKGNNLPVSLLVVDSKYPIYGKLELVTGEFSTPKDNEIYIDQNTANKLNISLKDTITFSNTSYTVAGIIAKDPRQLLSGFGFLPKVILSKEGFEASRLEKSLLRAEYEKRIIFIPGINNTQKKLIVDNASATGISVNVVGITQTGFIQGLSVVEQFLVLTVLLVCILSAVNMYASVLYLINVLKSSFSVLLALGLSKTKLALTVSFSFLYTLLISMILGAGIALGVVSLVFSEVADRFNLFLPYTSITLPVVITIGILFSVSLAAFVPSLRALLLLTPKELLERQQKISTKSLSLNLLIATFATLLPLAIIAALLLKNSTAGVLSIVGLASVYVFLAVLFYSIILWLYKTRFKYSFTLRSIISFKKADGLFGIVSLTSLYVALTALSVLILLQSSLTNFLQKDLGRRIPSLYVIDVQKSQVGDILAAYPEVTFFPNVGARIINIDGTDIQAALARGEQGVDRELGREYNLTYRKDMLSSEQLLSGAWLSGITNEVSVDVDFAKRANIELGSKVVVSIQGFPVESTVTSLRKTDSRSGLPFFFFVFNPNDLEKYPATFFGYGYYDEGQKRNLISYLSKNFANISVIDTKEVAAFAESIIGGLLVLVFIISIPPLILALFLIVTLIIASYLGRRKVSAQLTAIGALPRDITVMYYLETLSSVLLSSVLAYMTGVLVTYGISIYYLKLPSSSYYNLELIMAFSSIVLLVSIVAYAIRRSDKRSIREVLSYEE